MAGQAGDVPQAEPVSLDMEAMIDEILAKKGPQKYQDGLSEDKWEEVLHKSRATLLTLVL